MESEQPLKKKWKTPEIVLISPGYVNTGNHGGAHEGSILPGGTTSTPGGQHFDTFRTTKNFHLFTHTVPAASGPATNFFSS